MHVQIFDLTIKIDFNIKEDISVIDWKVSSKIENYIYIIFKNIPYLGMIRPNSVILLVKNI